MNKSPYNNKNIYIDPNAINLSKEKIRSEYMKQHWSAIAEKVGKKVLPYVLSLGVITAVGAFAYETIVTNSDPQNSENPNEAFGAVDDQISSIALEAGAKLRQDPTIPWVNDENQNDMLTLTDDIKLEVDGAHIKTDEANGLWFGISTNDLAASGLDISRFKSDKDGVVWVNTQKADAFDKNGKQISDTDTENLSVLNSVQKTTDKDSQDLNS